MMGQTHPRPMACPASSLSVLKFPRREFGRGRTSGSLDSSACSISLRSSLSGSIVSQSFARRAISDSAPSAAKRSTSSAGHSHSHRSLSVHAVRRFTISVTTGSKCIGPRIPPRLDGLFLSRRRTKVPGSLICSSEAAWRRTGGTRRPSVNSRTRVSDFRSSWRRVTTLTSSAAMNTEKKPIPYLPVGSKSLAVSPGHSLIARSESQYDSPKSRSGPDSTCCDMPNPSSCTSSQKESSEKKSRT